MSAQVIGNRYQVHIRLGEGGMGTVYRGLDTQTSETVAIKHLKPELLAADPQMLARFAREAEALRQLNHPHIVKALAAVEENGNHYIILEYVAGGSLADALHRDKILPISRVLDIALDLSDGLTRAHRLSIIHRDIKPANVLLADDGTPRLTDFGIAFMRGKARVTETNAVVGTLDYLSPEAFQTSEADARSDIWGFGVLLFEMLAGVRPFDRPTMSQTMMAILTEAPADLETLRPDCPIALVDLVYRMLEKDRQQRIPSVRQVSAELENILQGRSTSSARRVVIMQDTPTPTPTPAAKHNLPAQSTPFVGREDEIAELTRMISSARLITILAPGGMGKTRLALEVGARRALPSQDSPFSNGVYFVALAPLTSPDFIVSTIAEAVNFQFYQGGEPQQQVLDYLREKSMLLIMDNFEHVLDGAGIVSAILQYAPNVKIIATSRERLNLSGETLFALSGMDFPDWETPEDALDYAAVKLFLQSARRVRPDFELTPDDLKYVARICRLAAGMPLGIVLAATWLEMLSLSEIADEIANSIDFLETEMRDVPERQRSIRAVFDYSWNLMTPDEQAVFMRLSVFRGGFTREAAQEVAGASLKTLMSLVNKSLIRRDGTSGRYEIHELLRQYAEAQLKTASAYESARDAHSAYFAEFMYQRWEPLKTRRQAVVVDEIEAELENVRVAWDTLCSKRKADEIRRAAFSFWLAGDLRCRFHEMVERFGQAADTLRPISSEPEAERTLGLMLALQGWFCVGVGNVKKGKRLAQQGVDIVRRVGEPEDKIVALHGLSITTAFLAEFEEQTQIGQEMAEIARQSGNRWGLGRALLFVAGTPLAQGKFEEVIKIGQEGLEIAEDGGDLWMRAMYYIQIQGSVAMHQGKFAEAKRWYEESLRIFEELGMAFGIGLSFKLLALASASTLQFSEAWSYFRRSLKLFAETNQPDQTLDALQIVAQALIIQGEKVRAVEFLSLILQHPATLNHTRSEAASLLTQLQTEFPPDVYAAAWERGKSLDLNTVVAELLAES